MDDDREVLGRLVRHAWVEWAREQPNPKPGWLTGWDDLDPGQREVDMRIGKTVAVAAAGIAAAAILAHMEARDPGRGPLIGGTAAARTARRARRRHFRIAAQVAAGALSTDAEKLQMAAAALARGEFLGCTEPEEQP